MKDGISIDLFPHRFSRHQVVMIISLIVALFFFFRKDVQILFEQLDAYSTAHSAELVWVPIIVLLCGLGFLGAVCSCLCVYWPWRDRRDIKKREKKRVNDIVMHLWFSRSLISLIEYNMESFWLMLEHEAYKKVELPKEKPLLDEISIRAECPCPEAGRCGYTSQRPVPAICTKSVRRGVSQ